MLISTGVIGMLHSSATQDFHAVAEELAGYLAGPPVLIWDYAILDANFTTDAPIPVIDGWELVTPTSEDLRQMLPLPAAAKYQQKGPFKPQDYGGLTMFRRSLEQRPHHGPILRWDVPYSLALNRPAQPRTTVPGPAAARPADLLQRDFTATAPGRKWVADITYVEIASGFAYTSFVTDLFSRRIVGWQVSDTLRAELALDALEMAIWQAGNNIGDQLIHHSDRGVQYTSIRYSDRLGEIGAARSVGSKGDSYDNAAAEAVNSLYKKELIDREGPMA